MSEFETLLNAMLKGEKVDIVPQTRLEQYLKNCCDKCGCDGLPTPMSRTEILLYQLAEQMKNGGGGGGSGIIEVNELPTENINTAAFYLCDGALYKYVESNVWKLNDTVSTEGLTEAGYTTEFTDALGTPYDGIAKSGSYVMYRNEQTHAYGVVYMNDSWRKDEYKTITFQTTPDDVLLAWLKANATNDRVWQKLTSDSTGGIIEVDELPTENIDKEAFYLCNGEYYKGDYNTYVFNDEITFPPTSAAVRHAYFMDDSGEYYDGMLINSDGLKYMRNGKQRANAYLRDYNQWTSDIYKTITITKPLEEFNITVKEFIEENAVAQFSWRKYIIPTSIFEITANGTYDVTDYAKCKVSLSAVINVDTLPTENIDYKTLYKCGDSYYEPVKSFDGMYIQQEGEGGDIEQLLSAEMGMSLEKHYAKTPPTENVKAWDGTSQPIPVYYIEEWNTVECMVDGYWTPFFYAIMGEDMPISGTVTDISEITADGVWVLLGTGWQKYSLTT